ncbi:hypothetical protein [Rothia nasimurium]|uniref:hypothetical protein n=1 Tax=Rothia nasimurium TaxID=85336 RepID=UPI001F163F65|nr:hypothetical protein [Rothia nasimurium]
MDFSFALLVAPAFISAVVSALVAALIAWWRRPVVRWAITAKGAAHPFSSTPHHIDEPVYFRFAIHNVGDADAFGVKASLDGEPLLPLVPVVRSGSSLLEDDVQSFERPLVNGKIPSTIFEISFYESPVWRSRRHYQIQLSDLMEHEMLLSDSHLPRGLRWLARFW